MRELLTRCEDTIAYRTKHFVEDALCYARWIREVAEPERVELRRVIQRLTAENDALREAHREARRE